MSNQSQLIYYWKLSWFWKNWGSRNRVIKMDGLYSLTNALQMQNDFLAIVWWLDCNCQKMTCLLYDILVNFVINY